jgi:hypothetical protein
MLHAFRMRDKGCLIAALLVAAVAAAAAPGARAEGVTPPSNVFSTNPILDMFTWYNLEFEHRLAPNSTMGLAGTFVELGDGDDHYMALTAFYRYYPQNDAPAGFFFGGRAGVFGVTAEDDETDTEESATLGGIGIDIGYTWMIGSTRSFAISLGIGAIRLFGDIEDEDVAMTLPTIRAVNIGFAF